MLQRRVMHRVLVGKTEGKRALGRTLLCWYDNIKDGSSGIRMYGHRLDQAGRSP
jgi:hypothetical protein